MTATNQKLVEETPRESIDGNKKKPSACKIKDMPFDQRTLEVWVR